ncbi:DUF938 domain-containing protein [uncultured Roseobacter sp.]|uniref:DUF938 domain-containing protein n=1 Tax=uncultured Roseobacter sp. TaxID=114847 RepID=UPI00262B345B|nr:DUF938 domain-containing protein [uncultured Roseobacter sp.]
MSGDRRLPPSASVATPITGVKMHAPSAMRNAMALTELVSRHAPAKGRALELASGTGQHVTSFARAMPALDWQPTEIARDRMASIDAYAVDSGLKNLRPAAMLDATQDGWSERVPGRDLIVVVNLLHLISTPATRILLAQALSALAPSGRFVVYGPFRRDGKLTSDGDARFDADLRGADPAIGYKNDADVRAWLFEAGAADITCEEMPANNLAFVATR